MTSPTPSAQELAFTFDCEGETLVGILHQPTRPSQGRDAQRTGVVVVVDGPQHRAGSHRQFVHLARHLAAASPALPGRPKSTRCLGAAFRIRS